MTNESIDVFQRLQARFIFKRSSMAKNNNNMENFIEIVYL